MPHKKSVKELLDRWGLFKPLQEYRRIRLVMTCETYLSTSVLPLLIIEGRIRQNVQKELCVREQLENLRSHDALQKDDLLGAENLERELDVLRYEYWWLEREWWFCRGNFPTGPLTKGFELWRSNPQWYMHRVLREDCAGRGGCCSRDCGCCVNRATDLARPLSHGHCTVECGCCQKARGFDFTEEEKKRLANMFDFSNLKKEGFYPIERGTYLSRLYRASIWGVVVDCRPPT